jgi:hemerythrin superfamily protein
VTEYILAVTGKGAIGSGDAEPLARAMESFVLMYQNHAAREDTIVFPAWKETLSEHQLHEICDKFEEIERAQLGKVGYEGRRRANRANRADARACRPCAITAPPPPKA